MKPHKISVEKLTYRNIFQILREGLKLELSKDATERINRCRTYLDNRIASSDKRIFEKNAGLGSLYDKKNISDERHKIQENYIFSHACGIGEIVPERVVKIMLLLKIQSLSYGHSCVQLATVQRMIDLFNNNVIPIVYQQNALDSSGNMAPLAHLALPLLGLGEVFFEGVRFPTEDIYLKFKWQPIVLKPMEELALLNSTQFMSAYAVSTMIKSFRISELSDIIGAISIDVFDCRIEPYNELLHIIKHHKGQVQTVETINMLIEGSELMSQPKQHESDPFSFRGIPQIHGASKDAINYISNVFLNEINSITDNPTIFPEHNQILTGENFHNQPLALSLNFLAIALAELGDISERRINQILSEKRELPNFVASNHGLGAELINPKITTVEIVNQNRLLCSPTLMDVSDLSQNSETHIKTGSYAALNAYKVLENVEKILATELYFSAKALECKRPKKSSPFIEKFIERYRTFVPSTGNDTILHSEIEKTVEFLRTVKFHIPDELMDEIEKEK